MIQLKNGSWVNPSSVTVIQSTLNVIGEGFPNGGVARCVSIHLACGAILGVSGFSTDKEADEYRDQLARKIYARQGH